MLSHVQPSMKLLADQWGISLLEVPAFDYEQIDFQTIKQSILETYPSDIAVFSSKRAVEVLVETGLLQNAVCQRFIAATGPETALALSKAGYLPDWIGTGPSSSLASILLNSRHLFDIQSVTHYTGTAYDKSLMLMLTEYRITYQAVPLYIAHNKSITFDSNSIDGIGISSPAAVRALVQQKPEVRELPVYAIGQTTAQELSNKGFTNIYIAEEPRQIALLKAFVQHNHAEYVR